MADKPIRAEDVRALLVTWVANGVADPTLLEAFDQRHHPCTDEEGSE